MALSLPLVVPFVSLELLDPSGHLEWLAWVSLVPVLFALDRVAGPKRAFAVGGLAGVAYFFVAIYWVNHAMTAFGGLSPWFAFFALSLLVGYMAFHWGAAFALSWALRRRLGWSWWRHLPFTWVAAELSRNYLFTGFPWANLGYTQTRHLPVSQLASLFGVYAIAFLVVLVNCAVHEALRARLEGRPFPWRVAGATLALAAASVGFGYARLAAVRERMAAAPKLKVGLVQANVNQAVKNEARNRAEYILGRLVPLTVEADRAGADLVAWPEASYPSYVAPDAVALSPERSRLPRLERAHLLLGASTLRFREEDGVRRPEMTNSVFLLRPDLTVLKRYAKHHLVPFGEYVPLARWLPFIRQVVPSFAPASAGGKLEVMSFPLVRRAEGPPARPVSPSESTPASAIPGAAGPLAGAPARTVEAAVPQAPSGSPSSPDDWTALAPMICFDAIFPEINVTFARQEPEFLVNPTNDAWYGYSSGPYQFLSIVQLRAIETGRAVARPAYSGVSAIVLPTGEIAPGALPLGPVDEELAPDPDQPARLLLGDLPRMRGRTVYAGVGDLFAYGCVAYAAAAAVLARRRRRAGA